MKTPLHIVNKALPDVQGGYSIRSQSLITAQKAIGLNPFAVVVPATPVEVHNREIVGPGLVSYDHAGVTYLGCPNQSSTARKLTLKTAIALKNIGLRGLGRLIPYRVSAGTELKIINYICSKFEFDVVHAHSPKRCFDFAKKLSRAKGVPLLYEVRGFFYLSQEAEGSSNPNARAKRIASELKAFHAADHVATLGEAMKEHLIDLGVPAEKIALFPNGVDSLEPVNESERHEIRKRLNIHHEEFVCGCFTNVRKLEGLGTALQAIKLLKEDGHKVKFLLIGDGTDLKTQKALANTLGIHDLVIIQGRVPKAEIETYYSALDAYLIPRINKPVCQIVAPVKILEPMAKGVPLVVSDNPALVEHIGDDRGLTFEPENPRDLADKITSLIQSPEIGLAVADKAREWALDNRAWKQIAEFTKNIYYSQLGSHT